MRSVVVLLSLVFYSSLVAAETKTQPTVWVMRTFMGGPKCKSTGPVSHFTPPGFEAEKAKFLKPQIRVLREYYRDLATCQACHSCPNYHREIWFEIKESDVAASDKLGYRKAKNPPDAEELKEYEDAKRYRPKPDLPPED